MPRLIDGKAIAAALREELAAKVASLVARGRRPCLAAVRIGDDPGAVSYSQSQATSAGALGIEYRLIQIPAERTSADVEAEISRLNGDPGIHGVMIHLPVPKGLDGFQLQQLIAPGKDVEGVGAANFGLLAMGRPALAPCTAAAAFACLKYVKPNLEGCHAVVVGRSAIVGKPLAMLLLAANATVTQCHSRTPNLAEHTRRAEALIVAAGKAGLIGADYVAPGAIVIDVGTNRVNVTGGDGKSSSRLVGDVRFDEVATIASAITPVPGGVGPVTAAMLMANTVEAARRDNST
jgi:methylenetetrahydrofolate dehydrogenase (NADP+) / methenyltetrahydrofolate cyclohydrolase